MCISNLRELIAAVADELVRAFDEMLQPGRLSSTSRRSGSRSVAAASSIGLSVILRGAACWPTW